MKTLEEIIIEKNAQIEELSRKLDNYATNSDFVNTEKYVENII